MGTYEELLRSEDAGEVIEVIMEGIEENDNQYGRHIWSVDMALEAYYPKGYFNHSGERTVERDQAVCFFNQELERVLTSYNSNGE